MANAPSEPARTINPLCTALCPKPICSMSGSKNGMAPMPTRNKEPLTTDTAKVGRRMRPKSRTGSATRRAWRR